MAPTIATTQMLAMVTALVEVQRLDLALHGDRDLRLLDGGLDGGPDDGVDDRVEDAHDDHLRRERGSGYDGRRTDVVADDNP